MTTGVNNLRLNEVTRFVCFTGFVDGQQTNHAVNLRRLCVAAAFSALLAKGRRFVNQHLNNLPNAGCLARLRQPIPR